ncbi:3'-5' exonuclease [Chitinimonas sp. BJB300]|nr:3'-5' exonuclease [Chitinimonas sp. BJB300]
MSSTDGSKFYLTESHRFGAKIAEVANRILFVKGETRSIQGKRPNDAVGKLTYQKPFTTICRTNAGVFEQACLVPDGHQIYFVGGMDNYQFKRLEDTYHLRQGRPELVKDNYLRQFETFEALSSCADQTADPELRGLKYTVEEYGKDIPKLIRRINSMMVSDETKATRLLTNAHKAKGLQFAQVKLADDFISLSDYQTRCLGGKYKESELEAEINLLYVAATRAQQHLEIDEELLELSKPSSSKPSVTVSAIKSGADLKPSFFKRVFSR